MPDYAQGYNGRGTSSSSPRHPGLPWQSPPVSNYLTTKVEVCQYFLLKVFTSVDITQQDLCLQLCPFEGDMLTASQKGKAAQDLLGQACVIGSQGRLNVAFPHVDDEAVDIIILPEGWQPKGTVRPSEE